MASKKHQTKYELGKILKKIEVRKRYLKRKDMNLVSDFPLNQLYERADALTIKYKSL